MADVHSEGAREDPRDGQLLLILRRGGGLDDRTAAGAHGRERGVVVITADAADQAVLNEANAARARYLFAVTGNDSSNIERARTARQPMRRYSTGGPNINF